MPVVEFTVKGPPVSHQSKNKKALAAWKSVVSAAATKAWQQPPMTGRMKCTVMYFFEGPKAPLDDDNMAKPVRDAMNGIVHEDDSQIEHTQSSLIRVDATFQVRGVSKVILSAFADGDEFVYIRVEEAPFLVPLPQ